MEHFYGAHSTTLPRVQVGGTSIVVNIVPYLLNLCNSITCYTGSNVILHILSYDERNGMRQGPSDVGQLVIYWIGEESDNGLRKDSA